MALCLSFSSVSPFLVQLSSKELYWHDCPKLTIRLRALTLQSLSGAAFSAALKISSSSAPPVVSYSLPLPL